MLAYDVLPAPWGPVHLAVSESGLVALEVLTPPDLFVAGLEQRHRTEVAGRAAVTGPIRRMLDVATAAVEAYLAGDGEAIRAVPIDLRVRSAWDRRVLDGVRTVPYGRVTSYGRLARLVGSPGAARAAGGAVGRNPIGLAIPCHRVIAGDGSLGGYGGDWWGGRERLLEIKRDLLEREGVRLPATSFVG